MDLCRQDAYGMSLFLIIPEKDFNTAIVSNNRKWHDPKIIPFPKMSLTDYSQEGFWGLSITCFRHIR